MGFPQRRVILSILNVKIAIIRKRVFHNASKKSMLFFTWDQRTRLREDVFVSDKSRYQALHLSSIVFQSCLDGILPCGRHAVEVSERPGIRWRGLIISKKTTKVSAHPHASVEIFCKITFFKFLLLMRLYRHVYCVEGLNETAIMCSCVSIDQHHNTNPHVRASMKSNEKLKPFFSYNPAKALSKGLLGM